MKYGHFDDTNKEYVIETPYTPLPWINYLGSQNFFSLISNTGGGYSFYKDAKLRRITRYRYNNVPYDNGGRCYYICDGQTAWSPCFLPLKTPLDSYSCRHGLGYTVFESEKAGVKANLTCFVPLNDDCEINLLKLKNTSAENKELTVFALREFCLWNAVDDTSNFQRNFSTGEVEITENAIYHKTEYRERRNHYAFLFVNQKPVGYDSDRDTFLGKFNDFSSPEAVEKRTSFGSVASGWAPIASLQNKIVLAPNQALSLVYILGYIENPEEEKWEKPVVINKKRAISLQDKYKDEKAVLNALNELKAHWENLLSSYTVKTSEEKFDRMVNIWNQYQCMVTFNLSRSASYYESGIGRGMGFRDSCQDLLGFMHIIPERARGRIIDIASIQFEDGSTYHQYQPLDKKGNADIGGGFNDDPLWLVACTYSYLAETGDYSILDELVPFNNDVSKAQPLLEHLRRSINYTIKNKGPHGLPLIGRADWNDCLNLNCFSKEPGESFQTCSNFESGKAESVFIAGMFVKYAAEYIEILNKLGLDEESHSVSLEREKMIATIESYGWDGEWFVRAYDAFEKPVGSKECDEGQIYIEPQGMCVMAGVGVTNGKAKKALKSVEERLDTKYGIVLLNPAYTTYRLNLGEVSSYPPGYKENAGIFCHNNPWVSCAEAVVKNGERAFAIYKKICPAYIEDISDVHRTEPYVYSQMIAGKDAPHFGEAKNSWLTGCAAWTFVNASQYILGITPTLEGLKIDPCLPKEINAFKATRKIAGHTVHINAKRGNGYSLTVNGKDVDGNTVALNDKELHVEVIYL